MMHTHWRAFHARPHFIYRHLGSNGALLYVGCTSDPKRRPYVARPWSPEVVEITVEGPFSWVHALEIEEHQIRDYRPPYNTRLDNGSRDRRTWVEYVLEQDAGTVFPDHELGRRLDAAHAAHRARYPGATYGTRAEQAIA